jgi:hypothetical protein
VYRLILVTARARTTTTTTMSPMAKKSAQAKLLVGCEL